MEDNLLCRMICNPMRISKKSNKNHNYDGELLKLIKRKYPEHIINLNDLYSQVSHLDYSKIINNNFLRYHDVSDYPSSYRDFSFSIEDEVDIYELYKCIEESEIKFLKDFFMFDYYEDKKNNKIKIGYRFIFQSNKKTLTDEEINKSVENLIEPILSINSLTIPGL